MLAKVTLPFPATGMENNVSNIPTTIEDLIYMGGEDRSQEVPDIEKSINQNDKIVEATMVALETGELTPLIKEELRCSIQSRRLAEGKDEMEVKFEEPEKSELRPDEIEKIERRREQNRLAAQRFRQKQKSQGQVLLKKNQKLLTDNTRLRAELSRLQAEKEQLWKQLQDHLMICPLRGHQWDR